MFPQRPVSNELSQSQRVQVSNFEVRGSSPLGPRNPNHCRSQIPSTLTVMPLVPRLKGKGLAVSEYQIFRSKGQLQPFFPFKSTFCSITSSKPHLRCIALHSKFRCMMSVVILYSSSLLSGFDSLTDAFVSEKHPYLQLFSKDEHSCRPYLTYKLRLLW